MTETEPFQVIVGNDANGSPVVEEVRDVYDQALNHFGIYNQIVKAIEELGECSAALSRLLININDDKDSALRVAAAGETADALIMLCQMRRFLGKDTVDTLKQYKLDRLEKRIHGAKY